MYRLSLLGEAATPDNPYHAWAAASKPENVEVGYDLLALAKANGITSGTLPVVYNEDGSLSYATEGWNFASYGANNSSVILAQDLDLKNNPYLYWSIEQSAESSIQIGMYTSAAWFTARDGNSTEKLLTNDSNNFGKVFGSETGCVNLYEYLGSDDDALTIKELKFYGNGTDATFNYLFLGPAPTESGISLLPVYDQVTPVVNGQEGNLTITVDGTARSTQRRQPGAGRVPRLCMILRWRSILSRIRS